jgi:soluble lytic murein transglycosylase-like protein
VEHVNNKFFNGSLSEWVEDAAAMIFIESGDKKFEPSSMAHKNASRYERHKNDTSYGLMQVLTNTAKELHGKGAGKIPPTPAALMTLEGGVYYGIFYLYFLNRYYKPRLLQTKQDVIRAYNGGQGWKKNPNSVKATADYYGKYLRQLQVNNKIIG